ncbi:hypothetical protein J7L13_02730 [bacterium]|nr:hypothetical protein [bacterium]
MAEEQKTSSGEQKLMAVLCYLGILVLIPLVLKKSDPEVKFHIEQGLTLFVSWGNLVVCALDSVQISDWPGSLSHLVAGGSRLLGLGNHRNSERHPGREETFALARRIRQVFPPVEAKS